MFMLTAAATRLLEAAPISFSTLDHSLPASPPGDAARLDLVCDVLRLVGILCFTKRDGTRYAAARKVWNADIDRQVGLLTHPFPGMLASEQHDMSGC